MQAYLEQRKIAVVQAFQLKRPTLQTTLGPFDGIHKTANAVTETCLIAATAIANRQRQATLCHVNPERPLLPNNQVVLRSIQILSYLMDHYTIPKP